MLDTIIAELKEEWDVEGSAALEKAIQIVEKYKNQEEAERTGVMDMTKDYPGISITATFGEPKGNNVVRRMEETDDPHYGHRMKC